MHRTALSPRDSSVGRGRGSAATTGSVAAVSRIPGSSEVFFVGSDGSVQARFWYDG
jgi:hypothetical protein